jgi:hypothetical protein
MQVLVSLLKAIRECEATDKVVLVSNYTESLALCDKASKGLDGWAVWACWVGGWLIACLMSQLRAQLAEGGQQFGGAILAFSDIFSPL